MKYLESDLVFMTVVRLAVGKKHDFTTKIDIQKG